MSVRLFPAPRGGRSSRSSVARGLGAVLLLYGFGPAAAVAADGLAVAAATRTEPVAFEADVQPFLAANCVACHNESIQEGGLRLDTAEALAAGGDSGPGVVPGEGAQSLVFLRAAHRLDDPMPPADNKVGAKQLSPEELGLLARWIDEGAKAGPTTSRGSIAWKPLPPGQGAVVAAALSASGRFTAAARGGRVSLFDTASGRLLATLVDPALASRGGPADAAHFDIVHALAVSHTDDRIATGSFRTVKLWRRERPAAVPLADSAGATAVAAAPVGGVVAIGRSDGQVVVVDAASGATRRIIAAHSGDVTGLAFCDAGARLVSASRDGSIAVATVADGLIVGRLQRPGEVRCLARVADDTIAAADADGVIRLWRLPLPAPDADPASAPAPLAELAAGGQPIAALAAVPTLPRQLLSGGADGSVRLWSLETGAVVRQMAHGGGVSGLAVRPDGALVASVGTVPGVKLWDLGTGEPAGEWSGDPRLVDRLATADIELAVRKQDVDDGKARVAGAMKDIEAAAAETTQAAEKLVVAAKALGEKQAESKAAKLEEATKKAARAAQAATAAAESVTKAETALTVAKRAIEFAARQAERAAEALPPRQAELVEIETRAAAAERARAAVEAERIAAEKPLVAADWSPDGGWLVATDAAGTAVLLSGSNGQPRDVWECGGPEGRLAVAFLDATRVVVAGGPEAGAAWACAPRWVHDRTIGGETLPPVSEEAAGGPPVDVVTALAFSPDGTLLASGGGRPSRSGEIKLWRVADAGLVREFDSPHSDTVVALEFSRAGDLLASGGTDRFVRLHAVADGSHVRSFEGHTGHVLGVAWQAHGRRLASAGADRALKVWDVVSGDQQRTITGLKKEATAIRFLAAGAEVAAASGDPTVRIYNADDGKTVREFAGVGDFVQVLAAASGWLVAGCQDGKLRIWSAADGRLVHTLEPSAAVP